MIILAVEENKERGKLFEQFVSILLQKLGYQIVNTNIRKSGRELDIEAVTKITGEPLLVECKAHSKPIEGKFLSEFYGKYEVEYKRRKKLQGLMVSMSGFNSEVKEYYRVMPKSVKNRFKIVGFEGIIQYSVEAGLILDDKTVQHEAKKSWEFELDETILAITKYGYYRVQVLKKKGRKTHFLVYRDKGQDADKDEIDTMKRLIPVLKSLESYNLTLRKQILLLLAKNNKSISLNEIQNELEESEVSIKVEIDYLADRRIVQVSGEEASLVEDINTFCEVCKELLSSSLKYDFLQSSYFAEMDNEQLARYCLDRRHLDIQETHVNCLLKIFAVSPGSLYFALFGDIERYLQAYKHAKQIGFESDKLQDLILNSFFTELFPFLDEDIQDNENKVIRNLTPVPVVVKELGIALATTQGPIFQLKTGGAMSFIRASGQIMKGQLVSTDPLTHIDQRIAIYHILKDKDILREIEEIYQQNKCKLDKEYLAMIANNIGSCYKALDKWDKAREWFEEGLKHDDSLDILKQNLERLNQMGEGERDCSLHRN